MLPHYNENQHTQQTRHLPLPTYSTHDKRVWTPHHATVSMKWFQAPRTTYVPTLSGWPPYKIGTQGSGGECLSGSKFAGELFCGTAPISYSRAISKTYGKSHWLVAKPPIGQQESLAGCKTPYRAARVTGWLQNPLSGFDRLTPTSRCAQNNQESNQTSLVTSPM